MPRKPQKIDVQRTRRDNYAFHFECRQYVKSLPPELQMCYLEASRDTIPPKLNPYGADSYSEGEWAIIIRLAQSRGLQAYYINQWYVTDEGWNEFQQQWKTLPEEVEPLTINTDWILSRAPA